MKKKFSKNHHLVVLTDEIKNGISKWKK